MVYESGKKFWAGYVKDTQDLLLLSLQDAFTLYWFHLQRLAQSFKASLKRFWTEFHLGGAQTAATLKTATWNSSSRTTYKHKKYVKKHFLYALKINCFWFLATYILGCTFLEIIMRSQWIGAQKWCYKNSTQSSTGEPIQQHPPGLCKQTGKVRLAVQTSRQTTDDTSDCHIRRETLLQSTMKTK